LLTLLGIHILQRFFADKKVCWTLIVSKAINAIVNEAQQAGKPITKEEVQKLADEV